MRGARQGQPAQPGAPGEGGESAKGRSQAGAEEWAQGTSEGAEPAGCGWFESSRTLREGADVHEHQRLDAIVNDLPLAWWIEWAGLRAGVRRP